MMCNSERRNTDKQHKHNVEQNPKKRLIKAQNSANPFGGSTGTSKSNPVLDIWLLIPSLGLEG